ncbi:hypothetical protein [Pararhodobacter aggregans]
MTPDLATHLQQQQDRSTRLKGLLSTLALLEAEGWSGGDEYACLLEIARETNDALNVALDKVNLPQE